MKIKLTENREVFNFSTPYVIAEIGANHNGDMALAKQMIDAAKECGADSAKFQSWSPNSLIAKEEYDRNQKYDDSPKKHFGSLKEMVEKYYLRPDQHRELKDYCDTIGIDFCSTPFAPEEVDLLNDLGVPYHKVASMDINNLRLLTKIASSNKPVLLSTGMATLSEIERAVKTVEGEGNTRIVLLHCISIYPPAYEDIHLRNIEMLQSTFGYPVGFSDHTIGFSIPLASVALGCCLIEKHFTLDKSMPGWDHEISADPAEMKIIVEESRNIALSLGNSQRIVSKDEEVKKLKFRRSIVVRGDLKKGHILQVSDLDVKRPGTGIAPDEMPYVVGRTLSRALGNDELLLWNCLE